MMFWTRHDVILELRRQRHLNLPNILSVQKHCGMFGVVSDLSVWSKRLSERGELVFEGGCAEVRVCTHLYRVHVSS